MKYRLTIRALPGNWKGTPDSRLKIFLKAMKRGWGFSCEEVTEVTDETKPSSVKKFDPGTLTDIYT